MSGVDSHLVVYVISGVLIVIMAYIFLAIVTDGIKTINQKLLDEEKKKKEEEKKRRRAS